MASAVKISEAVRARVEPEGSVDGTEVKGGGGEEAGRENSSIPRIHQQPTHPQNTSKRCHVFPKEDCERARCQSIPPRTPPRVGQQCQHVTPPRKKSSPCL